MHVSKDFLALLILGCATQVMGHGLLSEPPARNTLWREGFSNPINYNDNGLNCGGFANQWERNNGKCGLCGDPYQGPRKHEAGYPGGYANGIISRHYKKGAVIDVEAKITANHLGQIAFKICPVNNKNSKVTQECFDRYPLTDVNGKKKISIFNQIGNSPGTIRAQLVLPNQLTCTQCVLQWYYTAGNNHGGPNTPQESFVNCADVRISVNGGPHPTPPPPVIDRRPEYKTDENGNDVLGQVWDCNLISPFDSGSNIQNNYNWCMANCIRAVPSQRSCPSDRCRCYLTEGMTTWPESSTTTAPTTRGGDIRDPDEWTCTLVPPYDTGSKRKVNNLQKWCIDNCVAALPQDRNCPPSTCNCFKDSTKTTTTTTAAPPGPRDPAQWTCDVVSPYDRATTANNIKRWCISNCINQPESLRFCPASHCNCYYTGKNGAQRSSSPRSQSSSRRSSNFYHGRVPYLDAQGICTLVRSRDESAYNSGSIRRWCANTCLPSYRTSRGNRSSRSRCNTGKCRCERF
ncbi:uncharacterized protein [Watersipora subatra]|uniref:uncharacterized protein n=1 Tax=Watersipora subatra TaxID=2589382 RepID=UPI00355C8DEE